MIQWSKIEPTHKQIEAIESYERVSNTKINYKSKQDAHDIISKFCGNGLTFKDGFIQSTEVSYIENGCSVNGKTLCNKPEFDTLRSKMPRHNTVEVLSGLSRQMNMLENDDSYEAGGTDPYFMFY